ncbi:MAG: hypothetical protein IKE64_03070, partial [Thermoguttaceae bacterium]|nr:hypothetical protein [Thermoguttaceae bacterium]
VRNTWLNLFGCLNSDIFFAYEPGVVKFTGFSGQSVVEYDGTLTTIDGVIYQAAQVYYDITFSFQGKPIAINESIGGIVCATVPGWAHVWPEVVKVDDTDTGRTVEMPVAIHVSDIHRYAAFNEVF